MSVTVTWKTLADGAEHAESFHGFAGLELAARRAYELTQSSGTYHVRIERPDAVPVEVARFSVEDCTGNDYGKYHEGRPTVERINGKHVVLCPYRHVVEVQPVEEWAHSALEAKASDPNWTVRCQGAIRPASADPGDYGAINDPPAPGDPDFEPYDCGGVWDGFEVTSDADPGL